MPKQGGRSASKRLKLKDKFKIIRKVKEHNRKKRKEAKKAGKKKPSLLKDPGIPSNYPYREQVVKEMAFEKDRILATEAARKEALKQKRIVRPPCCSSCPAPARTAPCGPWSSAECLACAAERLASAHQPAALTLRPLAQAKAAGEDEDMSVEAASEIARLGAAAALQQSDYDERAKAGLAADLVLGDNGAPLVRACKQYLRMHLLPLRRC